jgi:hypothetical protein
MSKLAKMAARAIAAHGNEWTRIVPASIADIERVERELGVTVPEELATFWTACAGGYPRRPFYWSAEHNIEVHVGYVLPLVDAAKRKGVIATCRAWRRAQRLPSDLIPFALDNGNANLICARTPGCEIVYFLHDDPDKPSNEVAGSLQEFLRGLTVPPY